MLVLDTDHVSFLQNDLSDEASRLTHHLDQAVGQVFCTTIITFEEQSRGWLAYVARANSAPLMVRQYSKLSEHVECYRKMLVLPFDNFAAREFGKLKAARIRIGTQDLKIAAITLSLGPTATLLSRNLKDFEKVPGLRVENWSV